MAEHYLKNKKTNPGGNIINPATEEKQDDIISAINSSSSSPAIDLEWLWEITIWLTKVELDFTWTTKTILITADEDNTDFIYIWKTDVTTGANYIYKLEAWDVVSIDYNDTTNALFAISWTASQKAVVWALK